MTTPEQSNGASAGCRHARLGDVLRLRKEVVHPRNNPTGLSTFVGLEHIESGTGRRIGSLAVDMAELTGRKPRFQKGDIVYGYLRPYLNKVWIADFDGLCSVDQYVYSVDSSLANPEFIAWFMRSPAYLETAPIDATPGQLPRIRTEEVAATKLILPPIAEQILIASGLNEQLAEVERARAAVAAQLQAAEDLPAAFLRAVFSTPAAQHWPRRNLADVCEIVAKQVDPRLPDYRDLPHVSGENIVSGICKLENIRSAAEDCMTSGKYLFEPGDVLYSKLRPYLRKAALPSFRGLCSADMYPIRVNPEVLDARFATWMLVSEPFTEYAIGESERSRMPKLNREQLFGWEAPLPRLAEQRTIAARINAEFDQAESLREQLAQKLAAVEKLAATLLREAFSGRA